MSGQDSIRIEILDDGSLKIEFDEVSPANHKQADEVLQFLLTKMGGSFTQGKRKVGHIHQHQHQHEHS